MDMLTGIVIGLISGGSGVWLLLAPRIRAAYEKGASTVITEKVTVEERLRGREEQVLALQNQMEEINLTLEKMREQCQHEIRGRIAAETLNQQIPALTEAFKALSSDALRSNNQTFLELARETLSRYQQGALGDLEKREQAIGALVKPLQESLVRVDHQIQEIEKTRIAAYTNLSDQVAAMAVSQTQLQGETANLVKALRSPVVRGRWGEIQLKRVVEVAGMLEYCDFVEQESTDTEQGGRLRPDMVVKLPNNKQVVVDSKSPLQGYLEAIEATNEDDKIRHLKAHAAQLRNHITNLSNKAYWDQFKHSPEFVVLFLPGEAFFSSALQYAPDLLEYGVERRVIIASPTTLIALLRSVAYGWRQEQVAQNAAEISRLGKNLYERIRGMATYLEDVRKGLDRTVDAYNRAIGSFEGRVFPAVRRFRDLGAGALDDFDILASIEKTPRVIQVPEVAMSLAATSDVDDPDR